MNGSTDEDVLKRTQKSLTDVSGFGKLLDDHLKYLSVLTFWDSIDFLSTFLHLRNGKNASRKKYFSVFSPLIGFEYNVTSVERYQKVGHSISNIIVPIFRFSNNEQNARF